MKTERLTIRINSVLGFPAKLYDTPSRDCVGNGGNQKTIEQRQKEVCDCINKLGHIEDIEEELGIDLKSASELLKWFIDNTMIASELMEFKKSSTHNECFEGWSHNGYPIQDDKFEEMRDLARTIKYKNGIRH